MKRRLIRWITSLYPDAWKSRYSEEFQALLEEQSLTVSVLLNVIISAMRERIHSGGISAMTKVQRTLTSIAAAWLLAVAAGLNFCATVDDTPFVKLMDVHRTLHLSWWLIELGSVVGLATVVGVLSPAVWPIIRHVWRTQRWGLVKWLGLPVSNGILLLFWLVAVLFWTDGHWIPTPWSVNGDYVSGWPEPHVRLALGLVTLVLLVGLFAGSALQFKRAVQHEAVAALREAALGNFLQRPLVKAGVKLFALSVLAMAAGIVLWGVLAAQLSPGDFQQPFGPFDSSFFVAWICSTVLFIIAAVNAIRCVLRLRHAAAE